jgi:STE24 endopeptidase
VNEDRATRYHRLKRRIGVLSLACRTLLLAGLLFSGATLWLRAVAENRAAAIVPPSMVAPASVIVYVLLLSMANEVLSLSLGFYGGFLLERRYGLSTETFRGWIVDRAKAFGIGAVFACGGASILYALIRHLPVWWWLAAGGVFALLIVGLTNVAPVVLLPLFYTIRPLDRQSLRVRLLALAERAGARVLGVYEWGLGDKTKKANAALTGLGGTRRILVSDTMLAEYSDDEIEVVLAHELAHHMHGDIWKGIAFESGLILAGFFAGAQVLDRLADRFALRDARDVAGLPLLLLAAGAVSLVAIPAANAISRAHERHADRFALDLTRNPSAFISAMRRLGAQNLAEDRPSRMIQWLFYSHPPIRERIAAAQAFKG